MSLKAYAVATAKLAHFFFGQLGNLRRLPPSVRDIEVDVLVTRGKDIDPPVLDAIQAEYNTKLAVLRGDIKGLVGGCEQRPFRDTLYYFFTLRIACVVATFVFPWYYTLAFLAAQFFLVPFSFFVSLTQFVALAPTLYVAHWLGYVATDFACRWVGAEFYVTLTPGFVAAFLLVDQLLCAGCALGILVPRPAPMAPHRLLHSVVYGFLNCKTYTWILLAYCVGLRVNMVAWVLDASFGLTQKAGRLLSAATLHWSVLFYHQHRTAHLPTVYQHAHKMHHYLHDSTAFDAHVYGSGAAEEFFTMAFELIPAVLAGVTPPMLGPHLLYTSFTNKDGHTRKADASLGANAHADHHTHHNKNFGIMTPAMDQTFGTMTNNDEYQAFGVQYTRVKDSGGMRFEFTAAEE